ncbi:MAG: helix-turn-helix domain-containing protein [Candidatus Caldarchaeales archaeon]
MAPEFGLSDRLRSSMRRLGLTDYEVRAYLGLLEVGSATAAELSGHTGIPISRIYGVINSLVEAGWVLAEGGRPTKYRPQDPETAVRASLSRARNLLEEAGRQLVEELSPLYRRSGDREMPQLWIVRGESELWRQTKALIAKAQVNLSVALPVLPEEVLQTLVPAASVMREKGREVRVLVGGGVGSRELRGLTDVASVRRRELTFGGGVIADSAEVLLILMDADQQRPKAGIYSDHAMLTALAQTYFDLLWSSSQPVD